MWRRLLVVAAILNETTRSRMNRLLSLIVILQIINREHDRVLDPARHSLVIIQVLERLCVVLTGVCGIRVSSRDNI